MPLSFIRAYPPARPSSSPAYWFPFRAGNVLVQDTGQQIALIEGDDAIASLLQAHEVYYLGTLNGTPCMTCEVDAERELPADWQAYSLRGLFGKLAAEMLNLVGYASQILYWQQTSRYCPVSGHLTEPEIGTWGRHCPHCGHVSYPHVTPAILVLVYDGERVLLTHKPGWDKRYSCIAGFTEPGETLEECAQREIYEEVGLEVTDVEYIGSQSWPFPHQLMVGFVARYVSGEIRIEEQELDDAKWFPIDELPQLPPPQSLAHTIIMTWAERQKHRG